MTSREKLMLAACLTTGMFGAVPAFGQVAYLTAGSTYSQNFDTLQATGTSGTTVPWADNSTLAGWYAALGTTTAPATVYRVSEGSSNSGSIYSFGALNDPDRAFGSVGSGSTGAAGGPTGIFYGVQLVNNTGSTLGAFTLSYTGEEWRATGTTTTTTIPNTLVFAYSTTATHVYDTTGYNAVTSLDFHAPAAGSPPAYTVADGPVNGNSTTYQTPISSTVTVTGGWAPGASLWVRWFDVNDAGNDQGLALDNLTFSAVPHVPQHNGTSLNVGGTKTPTVIDLGRVVSGVTTNTATVNLTNTGAASTGYADVSTDGSTATPATGTIAANGTTALSVKITGSSILATSVGSDVTRQAIIQNTGEDNDTNVTVSTKVHVVTNRFVDNYDPDSLGAASNGPTVPIDLGKVLVGATKTVAASFSTVNTTTSDYSSNSLTTVTLLASSAPVDGPIGGTTLATSFAKGTLTAGSTDVTFDDANDLASGRTISVTPLESGLVKASNGGGERAPGFLSVPLRQDDTAVGASGDARLYVSGDFYAPAAPVGNATPVAAGGTVTLTNTAPTTDSTSGKRLGADILGTAFNQSGWSVTGLPASIGPARAQYTTGTPVVTVAPVISSASGTISFDTTGKLNGAYGATLSISLQNDQTQGVYGVTAHDLPDTTVAVTGTVSDKPAVQSAAYTLNGGTLSAPATTLTGSFTQSGGSSTFASIIGKGGVTVSAGSLVLSPGATNLLGSLAISGTGKVDLTSAKLAIDYTGATVSNTIRTALLAGSASGWTGATGLTSTDAATHTAASYAIGYGEASLLLGSTGGTWNGVTVDGTALLIKETYYGDANLDGKVDADDLTLADRGNAKHLAAGSARWTDGDFNYDGNVTSADYLLMDTAYAQGGAALTPGFLAAREAEFGTAYVSSLIAAVPEPTSLSLVGLVGTSLIGRRRRSAK